VSAFVTDAQVNPSPTIIEVSLRDLPDGIEHALVSYSQVGLSSAGLLWDKEDSGQLYLEFRAPYSMAPGTYRDSVRIEGCEDSECTRKVSRGARTMSVSYTVRAASGANAAGVTFSPERLQLSDLVTSSGAGTDALIDMSFARAPIPPNVRVEHSSNAIWRLWTSTLANDRQQINMGLKTPGELGVGTYTDTLRISICIDPACVNPYPGNPYIVTVEYSITNVVGGENGYTVDVLPMPGTRELVADPIRDILFLAVDRSIKILDPVTRTVTRTVEVENEASALEVSADGRYLYASIKDAGKIQRFSLPQLTADISIALGSDATFGTPLSAREIRVAPGQPETIAVALSDGSIGAEGVVIFDNATARPERIPWPRDIYTDVAADSLQWGADSSVIYGANWTGQYQSLYAFSVDSSGIRVAATTNGIRTPNAQLHYARGLLYLDGGRIFDPSSRTLLDPLPLETPCICRLIPDQSLGKVFVGGAQIFGFGEVLAVFDIETHDLIGRAALPYSIGVHHLARWGSDGLAMVAHVSNGPAVILIRGSLISD
jgi:hypothetical protein